MKCRRLGGVKQQIRIPSQRGGHEPEIEIAAGPCSRAAPYLSLRFQWLLVISDPMTKHFLEGTVPGRRTDEQSSGVRAGVERVVSYRRDLGDIGGIQCAWGTQKL